MPRKFWFFKQKIIRISWGWRGCPVPAPLLCNAFCNGRSQLSLTYFSTQLNFWTFIRSFIWDFSNILFCSHCIIKQNIWEVLYKASYMKKTRCQIQEKKSRFAEPEFFIGFETNLDFKKSGCRLKGRWWDYVKKVFNFSKVQECPLYILLMISDNQMHPKMWA